MLKCVLFNSPIYREHRNEKEDYLPPLGLGYIATGLIRAEIDVVLVDCVKDHLGVDDIFAVLKKERPEYIGINVFTQNYAIVKEILENCPVETTMLIGGPVVKCIYQEILQWNVSNKMHVIIGEGELLIPALISGTCEEVPVEVHGGISVYRVDKNSPYFPQDISSVSIDRTLFKNYTVFNHYGEAEAAIVTSRGCMYNCAFCGGAHSLNQDVTIRYRTITDIEREIEAILTISPEVTSIRMLDDLFLRDQWSIDNAVSMFKKFEGLSWRGMAHILTFAKSLDSLSALKESGCRELFVGIESGSPKMRQIINKPGTIDQVVDVVSAIMDAGIDVKGYFMYGFPKETVLDGEMTYSLAEKLMNVSKDTRGAFRTSVFQFRPYHGTKLYNELIEEGKEVFPIASNPNLNVIDGRTQFNFQSGNYSDIPDDRLHELIIMTQLLSRDSDVRKN